MFHVGQKVTLVVRLNSKTGPWGEALPEFGIVYTVRSISVDDDGAFVRFIEIVNRPLPYSDGLIECQFQANAFRPVTDIGIFEAMLKRAPVPEMEDA